MLEPQPGSPEDLLGKILFRLRETYRLTDVIVIFNLVQTLLLVAILGTLLWKL